MLICTRKAAPRVLGSISVTVMHQFLVSVHRRLASNTVDVGHREASDRKFNRSAKHHLDIGLDEEQSSGMHGIYALKADPHFKKFSLRKTFVDAYKELDPPFGFNGLGALVYRRTYSRRKDDGI